jgi:NADPH:quinone reductase
MEPLAGLCLEPVFQIPSGRMLTVFASALVTGTPEFPLSEIPFQEMIDRVAAGIYEARPAKVFRLEDIRKRIASWSRSRQTERSS